MSGELVLNFPNSETPKTTDWDILTDTETDAAAGEAYMEVELGNEDEQIKQLKQTIIAEKHSVQTLAKVYCGDTQSSLTSDDLRVAESNYRFRDEVAGDYVRLTDSELNLIETIDERDRGARRAEAEEYVSTHDESGAAMAVAHDIIGVNRALEEYNRAGKRRIVQGWRDRREALGALKKFGYNPDGPQSEVFSLILQQAKAIRLGIPTKDTQVDDMLGRKRACDYQETMLLLSDEATSNNCRRALKKAGYKELPESWSDRNFSTHDIAEMCRIAREAAA